MPGKTLKTNPIHDIYWDLASLSIETRKGAVEKLVIALKEKQVDFAKENNAEPAIEKYLADAEGDFELLKLALHDDVSYGINRLVRGIASSREAARQGFTNALTEILCADCLKFVRTDTIFKLSLKHHTTTGGMKNVEIKDALLGRFFTVISIHKAGMLTNRERTQEAVLEKIIVSVLDWLKEKNYLYEFATELLIEIVDAIPEKKLKKQMLKAVMNSLMLTDGKENDEAVLEPHQLMLAVHYYKVSKSDLTWEKYLINWKNNNICKPANCGLLVQSIKETSYTVPRLHSAVSSLLSLLVELKDESVVSIPRLWNELSTQCLNSTKPAQKLLMLSVFKYLLQILPDSDISKLFSRQFIRFIVNSVGSREHLLTPAARNTVKAIIATATSRPDCAFPIIACLTGSEGNQSFDALTKTNTIEKLVESLTAEGSMQYLDTLLAHYKANSSNEDELDGQCQFALDQMLNICKNRRAPRTRAFYEKLLKFICDEAYLKHSVTAVQSRLVTILGLIQKHSGTSEFSFYDTLRYVNELCKPKSNVIQNAFDIKKADMSDKASAAFAEFVEWVKFESLQKPESSEQALAELESIWKRIKAQNTSSKRKHDSEHDGMQPSDVLVDLILSILSDTSALGRAVLENVFKNFTSGITEEGWTSLYEALENDDALSPNEADESEAEGSESDEESSEAEGSESENDDEELARKLDDIAENPANSSSSEEELDDDQMLALDKNLASFVKLRTLEKTKKRRQETATNHFRIRVLSLLEIYVRNEPSSPIIPHIISTVGHLTTQQGLKSSPHWVFHNRAVAFVRSCLVSAKLEAPSFYAADAEKREKYDILVKECIDEIVEDLRGNLYLSTYKVLSALLANLLKLVWSLDSIDLVSVKKASSKKQKTETGKANERVQWQEYCKKVLSELYNDFISGKASKMKPDLFTVLIEKRPSLSFDCLFNSIVDSVTLKCTFRIKVKNYASACRLLNHMLNRHAASRQTDSQKQAFDNVKRSIIDTFDRLEEFKTSPPPCLKKNNFFSNPKSAKMLEKLMKPILKKCRD